MTPAAPDEVRRLIDEALGAAEDGAVSAAWLSLTGTPLLLHDADRPYYAASTMKVAVMVEVFRQAERGRLDLRREVPVVGRFRSAVDGLPYVLQAADSDAELLQRESATLRELVERMITRSSNEATNLLLEVVGVEAVDALGGTSSVVQRAIGDVAARAAGLTNLVTAWELAAQLRAVAVGEAAGGAACSEMLGILLRQQLVDLIPAGLPAAVPAAGKSGEAFGALHDGAVVWPPDGAPYVLAVCTQGIAAPAGEALIRGLSAAVYARRGEVGR